MPTFLLTSSRVRPYYLAHLLINIKNSPGFRIMDKKGIICFIGYLAVIIMQYAWGMLCLFVTDPRFLRPGIPPVCCREFMNGSFFGLLLVFHLTRGL